MLKRRSTVMLVLLVVSTGGAGCATPREAQDAVDITQAQAHIVRYCTAAHTDRSAEERRAARDAAREILAIVRRHTSDDAISRKVRQSAVRFVDELRGSGCGERWAADVQRALERAR